MSNPCPQIRVDVEEPLKADGAARRVVEVTGGSKQVRFDALDGMRYVASCNICVHHLFQDAFHVPFWGSTWTQFFFLLSGFVLTTSELLRPSANSISTVEYLKKRLSSVLPIYWFWFTFKTLQLGIPSHAHDRMCYALGAVLLHAWYPSCIASWDGTMWHVWFMSALFGYWLLVRPLSSKVLSSHVGAFGSLLILCSCWLWSLVIAAFDVRIMHEESKLCAGMRWFIGFGPLGYLHVFLGGCAAAKLFICTFLASNGPSPGATYRHISESENSERVPDFVADTSWRLSCKAICFCVIRNCGLTLSYLSFFALLILLPKPWTSLADSISDRDTGATERFIRCFLHNGGLMPVHVVGLFSASLGKDPCSRILGSSFGKWFGAFSYEQYVMQFVVAHFIWMSGCPSKFVFSILFFPTSAVIAYASHNVVTKTFAPRMRALQVPDGGKEKS
eukprot:TRINITY_DN71671_c0_g1_i1.p1 TRINITY_DN71671_c0_g1~~TRINITY_DN71671_c0_g1_i1.p1  ORF type:complete len:455 (-),score=33.20 TRINITY_DN71671_c0_g1_i1:96-1436(-)